MHACVLVLKKMVASSSLANVCTRHLKRFIVVYLIMVLPHSRPVTNDYSTSLYACQFFSLRECLCASMKGIVAADPQN